MAISCIENMKANVAEAITWKKLAKAKSETIVFPFQLNIVDSDDPLICRELLRLVPGKRMVLSALWGEQQVVVKVFYGAHAKRHLKRDAAGAEALQQVNVPSPKLLYQGSAFKKRLQVLIFEKIEECANLESIWLDRDSYLAIDALMRSFTIELATQHVLGILQRDLHFKNFLVTDTRIYTLDGGAVTQFDSPLDKKTSLENLGLFFAQLGAGTKALQQDLFKVYVKARGWLLKSADIDILENAIKTANQERWRRFSKKIFRNSTTFKKIKTFFSSGIYDRDYASPALLHFLQHPETLFNDPNAQLLKKGRSSTVIKLKVDNKIWVVKRYNIKNPLHWLRRCLRMTRAKNAWRLAQRLRMFGVATPKPIAYLDTHALGFRGKSYFLMEYLSGEDSGQFFAKYQKDNPLFITMGKRIIALIESLSELNMTHGDLKNTNIIIHREQPFFIDLDGMVEHKLGVSFSRTYKKELQRFMRNWDNQADLTQMFSSLLKGINDGATTQ